MKQLKDDLISHQVENIRNFDAKKYQGLVIELELGDINKFGNQYVITKKNQAFPFEFGGRIEKTLGVHQKTITRKIEHLGLIQGGNWLFQNRHVYNSYGEYFNQDRKGQLMAAWHRADFSVNRVLSPNFMLKLSTIARKINPQVSLTFDDFVLETRYEQGFHYPKEWATEFLADFKFENDCYASADEAISNLKPERFATTTVAILTIPKSLPNARKLIAISGTSAASPLLVREEQLLMAVRYEDYPAVIYNIYELGGAVARS